jgi:hypothetical protein
MESEWILSDKSQVLFIGNKESVMYLLVIDPNNPPIIMDILASALSLGKNILELAIRKEINNAKNSFKNNV